MRAYKLDCDVFVTDDEVITFVCEKMKHGLLFILLMDQVLCVSVAFHSDFPTIVKLRVSSYMERVLGDSLSIIDCQDHSNAFLHLSFGCDYPWFRLPQEEESFQVHVNQSESQKLVHVVAKNRGLLYGTFAVLERLGFRWFHFQEPVVPSLRTFWSNFETRLRDGFQEQPYWTIRRWHIHTQHPLELTHFLNGMDTVTKSGQLVESWASMIPEWNNMLEWLIANRQNGVEWVLLWAHSWRDFASSSKRTHRLELITRICHEWLLECGVDVPLALQQQHSFTLTRERTRGGTSTPLLNIVENVQWLMSMGFDFLSTELGSTEFTRGASCERMLEWLDTAATTLQHYNITFPVKIHVSHGQTCNDGSNFNFIPSRAQPNVALMAHTVQVPAWNQNAGGTYARENFTFMMDYMFHEQNRHRVKLWYPETSYWVNYDIDVPLFLPVYALARVRDLRHIARTETMLNNKIDGQVVFESGWEWMYWLNNVVAARTSWNPYPELETDEEALRTLLVDVFWSGSSDLSYFVVDYALMQEHLLIERGGIAHLVGRETWSTVTSLVGVRTLPLINASDTELVQFMLTEARQFQERFMKQVHRPSLLSDELQDALAVTRYRAEQVYHLQQRSNLAAREATLKAVEVMKRRSSQYRTAHWRTHSHKVCNPTVYGYSYLWASSNGYFFIRDQLIAERSSPMFWNPCYMNMINPIDVVMGDGLTKRSLGRVYKFIRRVVPWNSVTSCFVPNLDAIQQNLDAFAMQ